MKDFSIFIVNKMAKSCLVIEFMRVYVRQFKSINNP